MHRVNLIALAGLIATVVTVAGGHRAMAASGGRCWAYRNGQYVAVACHYGNGWVGDLGSAKPLRLDCGTRELSPAEAKVDGLPPAPKGEAWFEMTCHNMAPSPYYFLGSTTGPPPVTPRRLLQIALSEMYIPQLGVKTAPPQSVKALVGLPEWFWITPSEWHPISVTATAGPVWATAVATPTRLTFDPGGVLAAVSCQGPGTPYNGKLPAAGQHTDCSYTYPQSSAAQPGRRYAASVTVTWVITWTGSGGVGGTVDSGLDVPTPLPLRVAEGQALVTSG